MSVGMKNVDDYIDSETKVLVYAITRKKWESIKRSFKKIVGLFVILIEIIKMRSENNEKNL